LGEATTLLVLVAYVFFSFVKVKLDVIFCPLWFIIDLDLNILVFFKVIGRLIFFSADPSKTVFAVPLLHGVQFRLRFVAEVGRALRMQPRSVGAFLVTIAFHEEL
jgi:hypothetical protein